MPTPDFSMLTPSIALLAAIFHSVHALDVQTASAPMEIRVAPSAGSTWAKQFRVESRSTGGELSVVMNDAEVPPMFLPQLEMNATLQVEREFVDRYDDISDARVTAFTRQVDLAQRRGNYSFDDGTDATDDSAESESTLLGASLDYRWNERDDAFVAENTGESESAESLQAEPLPRWGLASCAALAPDATVEVGDTWSVPAEVLDQLTHPGGLIDEPLGIESAEWMDESLGAEDWSGELELRLEEILDGDGERRARIAIAGDVESSSSRATDLAQVPVVDGTATETTTMEFAVEGWIEWDLERGHVRTLSIAAEIEHLSHTVRDPDQEGPSYSSDFEFQSQLTIEASFDPQE